MAQMIHFYKMQPSEFQALPEEAVEGLHSWMEEYFSRRG